MKSRSHSAAPFLSVSVLCFCASAALAQAPTFSRYDSPMGQPAVAVAAGDLNGDLRPDLVLASNNSITAMLGNGNGTFVRGKTVKVLANPMFLNIMDLNGDLKPDLVIVHNNSSSSGVSVLLGDGTGGLQLQVFYKLNAAPQSLAVADVNHDSHSDLLLPLANGALAVMLGNANGTFQDPVYIQAGVSLVSAQAGDFNNDNNPDVAVLNYDSSVPQGSVSILLGDGAGGFQPSTSYTVPVTPVAMTSTDLNGDSRPDLVVTDSTGTASVLLGNGDGTFQGPAAFPEGGYPFPAIGVADFNHDGRMDILSANLSKNAVTVSFLSSNGDGTLQSPQMIGLTLWLAPAPNTNRIAIADFNRDGKPDFVAVYQSKVWRYVMSMFLNTTP